jgi:Fe-S-cluster containining protein
MAEADCVETESVTFVCEKCGECCRHIESLIEIWPYQRNGVCQYLQGDLCSIYKNRPDLCDYKRAYKYLKGNMTETEYQERTLYYCEQLKASKK